MISQNTLNIYRFKNLDSPNIEFYRKCKPTLQYERVRITAPENSDILTFCNSLSHQINLNRLSKMKLRSVFLRAESLCNGFRSK